MRHNTGGGGCWCGPKIIATEGANVIVHKELVPYEDIFIGVMDGDLVLTNDREGTLMASWKAGGQDFYIYARNV